MKKHNLLVLLAATGLLGGCAATLTPTGEIYTEALLPVDTTVVVESYPLVAYGPRPHYQPALPPAHRGSLRPGPHFGPHRGPSRYGAPGQHRSPGQHRAPGVRGPRTPHHGSYGNPGFRGQRPSGQAGPGKTQRGPQGSHGPRQNSHSAPSSRGPR